MTRYDTDTAPVPELSVKHMLDLADEIERTEARIKQAVMFAASAGDCARVLDIMCRWATKPLAEVLEPDGDTHKLPPSGGTPLLDAGVPR